MISTGGVNLVQPFQAPLPVFAADVQPIAKKVGAKKVLEVGLRDDADLTVKAIEKLAFATALAASIKSGAAPNLKVVNVAGNRGITETDKRALRASRQGLEVSVVKLKNKADGEVYKRVDDGKLGKRDV